MKNNTEEMQSIIFNLYFKEEDIIFLSDFQDKKNSTNKEIEKIHTIEEKVLNKISNDKKNLENDPRKLRKYINNSESVVESVESVVVNLNELLKIYQKVEEKLEVITKKFGENFDNYNLEEDMKILQNEIDSARKLEIATKNDNEKNYLIIDNFLNKTFEYKDYNVKVNKDEEKSDDELENNMVLKIYEKRVELPYTKKEIEDYMATYPNEYKTAEDVISKEFIVHISLFNKHPVLSRFKEAYYLCRTKEMMPIFDSFDYAKSIMFRSDLNSYIIAAVKSKKQLEDYIYCLDNNKLNEFKYFKIIFNVNPLAV